MSGAKRPTPEQTARWTAIRVEDIETQKLLETDIHAPAALRDAWSDKRAALAAEVTAIEATLVTPEPPVEPIFGLSITDAVEELAALRRRPEYYDPRSLEEGKALHARALRLLATAYPVIPGLPTPTREVTAQEMFDTIFRAQHAPPAEPVAVPARIAPSLDPDLHAALHSGA